MLCLTISSFFFFNDTATTEIYTLSLHDALPILSDTFAESNVPFLDMAANQIELGQKIAELLKPVLDRKSTRLNSSHLVISYAVFCLKKKKKNNSTTDIIKENVKTILLVSHVSRA